MVHEILLMVGIAATAVTLFGLGMLIGMRVGTERTIVRRRIMGH